MNDQKIEQEIQAKGLTAPRVTPADIEANIVGTYWFTAADGANKAGYREDLDPLTAQNSPLGLLTFCVLVLRNGFTVTGESACASPENFDAEMGRKIARANAVNKVWPLMGYALKERIGGSHTHAAPSLAITGTPDKMHIPMPDGSAFVLTKVANDAPTPSAADRLDAHIKMVKESGWAPGTGAGSDGLKKTYTFDEFVQYGRNAGANIVNGMPWSWTFHGRAVSHENDQRYLISVPNSVDSLSFTPSHVLVVDDDGELFLKPAI